MKYYIYKKTNKDSDDKKNNRVQIPIYAWRDPLHDSSDYKNDFEKKENSYEKRGYEELDFNIDSFIIDN